MVHPLLAWRVSNLGPGEAEIDIFDTIGDPYEGTTAKAFIEELRGLDVERLHVNINSPGGYVDDGLAIYNAILRHPAEVTAHIIVAQSAASFIAQAADRRLIAKSGKLFIHDAQGFGLGSSADMRALATLLDEESDNIAAIYADRAGGSVEDWRTRMQADGFGSSYRGQEAVDIGLADEVEVSTREAARAGALAPQEMRIAAQVDSEDIPLDLIPSLGPAYKPPQPDLTRLVAANLPVLKEAK